MKFSLPMPALLFHDHSQPVGKVVDAKASKDGIKFKMVLPKAGLLPEIDRARKLVAAGIIRAVSVGFRAIKTAYNRETGGIRFQESEWFELSLVSVPMNAEATITSVKSIVADYGRASAASGVVRLAPAAAGGSTTRSGGTDASRTIIHSTGATTMKTIAEQIAAFEAKRKKAQDDVLALVQRTVDEGRTFDDAEKEAHAALVAEVKAIDDHLTVLRSTERMNVQTATPVDAAAGTSGETAVQVRSGAVITTQRNLPKGTGFTRYVMALVRCKGNLAEAAAFANAQTTAKRWDDTPEVERVIRAAVDAGTTTDADWASKLVEYNTLAGEFIELLRPMTILGRFGTGNIPSLRRIPFNVRMATQSAGGVYGWVGEGAAKPVGELSIGEVTLRWAKAAGIIVVTDELMRMSNPSVEAVVRNDMLAGMANFSDLQFVSPSVAEVPNVSPASVFNGVTPVPSSGTDAAALRADLGTLWEAFFAANLAPTTGVFIMSNRQAMRISLMRNPLGQKEFPDMTPLGGVLEGFPVITSEAVPDTSDGGMIGFVNASDIFYSDDGPVTIDASREASLQMNTTPDNPTTASTVLVSLWQRNLVGLRAERYMNWKKRRAAAAGYISGTNYGTVS
jgi:HK97 family phage major capsid protein/HK97 family phage prohead protease